MPPPVWGPLWGVVSPSGRINSKLQSPVNTLRAMPPKSHARSRKPARVGGAALLAPRSGAPRGRETARASVPRRHASGPPSSIAGRDTVRGPLGPEVWYDALAVPGNYDRAMAAVVSGCLIEFEVLGDAGGSRGPLIAEVIRQKLSSMAGVPVILIAPVVAREDPVTRWMHGSLTAPNGITICRQAPRLTDTGSESYYIHRV